MTRVYERSAILDFTELTDEQQQQINKLVRRFLPDLYEDLALKFYNPYNYSRTKTHIILVHSGIEYFLKYD